MNKKILSILLTAAILVSLSACHDNGIGAATEPSDQESTAAPLETEGASPTETPTATEKTAPTDPTESTTPTETTEVTTATEATEEPASTKTTESSNTNSVCATNGHNWTAATCAEASTCSVCGRTFGFALGHEWAPATSITPKTCSRCGKTEGSALESSANYFPGVTVTIIAYSGLETFEADNYWFYEQIEKKFGCDIVVIEIPEMLATGKLSDMLASGTFPTIIPTFLSSDQINTLGEQGKFVDVMSPENLAKMPNFAKLFASDNSINHEYMMTAAQDGSNYVLPQYNCKRSVEHYWIYNETAFEQAGVTWSGDVTNDGFLDMLRALKRYDPDSYPLTGVAWQSTLDRLIFSFGVNSSLAAYDWDKGEWFYGATTDECYSMMHLLQTAYNEELMDPLFLTANNNSAALQKNMASHNSYLYYSWLGWMTMHNTAYIENGVSDHEIPAPTLVGTNGKLPDLKEFESTTGVMINASDPVAAECAMAIMNWMYDTSKDGGAWLATVGPDHILTKNENGKNCWTPNSTSGDMTCDIEDVSEFGMFNPSLTVRYCLESPYFTFNEEEQLAQDIGERAGYLKAPPVLEITDTEIAAVYADSRRDFAYMIDMFILENWDRAQFDAWATEFNAKYQPVLDYLNA